MGVEFLHVGAGNGADFLLPADDRPAAPMLGAPHPRLEGFPEAGARVAVGALAALLQHHGALGLDGLGRQQRAAEAVRFHPHHQRQAAGFHRLVVGGDIARGEGIVLPALPRHGQAEGAGGDVGLPLNIMCSRKWARPERPEGSSPPPAA